MKTIENINIYKCDFCNKELKRKHAMLNHELKCNNNPLNKKACNDGCNYLVRQEISVLFEGNYNQDPKEIKVNCFKCEKLNKLMYPYKIEKSNALKDYTETFKEQEPMPKECEFFNDGIPIEIKNLFNN